MCELSIGINIGRRHSGLNNIDCCRVHVCILPQQWAIITGVIVFRTYCKYPLVGVDASSLQADFQASLLALSVGARYSQGPFGYKAHSQGIPQDHPRP